MTTHTKNKEPRVHDAYLDLICRLPLKPIASDDEHEQAVAIITELLGRKLGAGSSDYLDTLILLVNKYEDENHTPAGTDLSPQQALRAIMNANGLSQTDIGEIIGSNSAVSMFLTGERDLSKAHIKAIAARFRVNASLFF
jgi:HTH-type transcriptional regulator/antitoxin HigA